MRVAIRADAAAHIGGGHVMRCLCLAQALREQGANVEFITRAGPQDLSATLARAGFAVRMLPPARQAAASVSTAYDTWLGESWQTDLRQTLEAIGSGERPQWLVVDHYGIAAPWEQGARERCGRLLVIDDLANRRHACDVLLDQNLYPALESRYAKLVPAACRQLLGPGYALLRNEFHLARLSHAPADGAIRRILVSFGVGDARSMTLEALRAIEQVDAPAIAVDAVVGAMNRDGDAIRRLCARHERWAVHEGTDEMAKLMASAQVAIGGGGTTTWERCALGLPSFIVALSDNQGPIAEAVHAAGAAVYLGPAQRVKADDIAAALSHALNDARFVKQLAGKALGLVDGLGTGRVLAALGELALSS